MPSIRHTSKSFSALHLSRQATRSRSILVSEVRAGRSGDPVQEVAELGKVRDIKQRVTSQLEVRKDIETKGIKDILMRMGGNRADNLGALQAAVIGTDPGVRRLGNSTCTVPCPLQKS